jgi:repressor LexA
MANLTPKQLQVLRLIHEHRTKRGYAPTMQELADRLGVSKVTVFEHVEALIKKGLLNRDPNKARSLEVVPNFEFPDEMAAGLPVMGRIAAGKPIEAIEAKETLDLGSLFVNDGHTFVLHVQGDSMIEKHICDGDQLIIRRQETANEGDVVVALLDNGEVTLKSFYRENNRIRLQPANAAMEPIYVDNVKVQGVVVGVLRRYAYRAR